MTLRETVRDQYAVPTRMTSSEENPESARTVNTRTSIEVTGNADECGMGLDLGQVPHDVCWR